MKKYIYIILGVIIVAAIVIVLLLLFGNKGPANNGQQGTPGTLPGVGSQMGATGINGSNGQGGATGAATGTTQTFTSFGPISSGPILDFFADAQGHVFTIDPSGVVQEIAGSQTSTLSSPKIIDIISASFSYDGKKILVSFGDQGNPQTSVFDVTSKTWSPLPQGLLSPHWAPADYRIAYLKNGATGMVLSVVNMATPKASPATLLSLNAIDLTLQWLNGSQLLLADRPSANAASSLLLFDLVSKNLTPVVIEASGLESVWIDKTSSSSPMGLTFSGSAASGYGLHLINLSGSLLQSLTFATLPSKCAFIAASADGGTTGGRAASSTASSTPKMNTGSKTFPVFYCGIPRDQATFLSDKLPDSYDQKALFTSDSLYKINALTGAVTTIWADPNQNMDISDLKYFNGLLFFVNRYDQRLYSVTPASL